MADPVIFDVDEATFDARVVERSREVPVVVDFWAAWCAPCRTLGPTLERAVESRADEVELAKVDVDRDPQLAARFGIRGIPAVKGFRDGEVVDEFVGAQGPAQIEAFLDRLAPTAADRLVASARRRAEDAPEEAEEALRRALELEPSHRDAAIALAGLLLPRDPDGAVELVQRHRPAPEAEEIVARADLVRSGGDLDELRSRVREAPGDDEARLRLGRALAAHGEHERAVEELLEVVRAGGDAADDARQQILAIFRLAGDDAPFVPDARRRLANALY